MARSVVQIRVDEAKKQRWVERAGSMSLSAWLSSLADADCEPGESPTVKPSVAPRFTSAAPFVDGKCSSPQLHRKGWKCPVCRQMF